MSWIVLTVEEVRAGRGGSHEMRYHGAVDIVSGDRTLRAEDVVLAEW